MFNRQLSIRLKIERYGTLSFFEKKMVKTMLTTSLWRKESERADESERKGNDREEKERERERETNGVNEQKNKKERERKDF